MALSHFGDKPALGAGETVIALSVRPAVDGYWLFTNLGRVIAVWRRCSFW